MPVSETQSASPSRGLSRNERNIGQTTGRIDRTLLTPRFDTYKLSEYQILVLEASAQVPGGGVRCTAAQLGGGVDFASTSFRVRFNDLQPDRSDPQGSFFIVTCDSSLRPVSVRPSSLDIGDPFPIRPELERGEIASVVASGQLVVLCRQGGRLSLLRRTPQPAGTTTLQTEMLLSAHGSKCDVMHESDGRLESDDASDRDWSTQYYILDVCHTEGSGDSPATATLLLAVFSRHGPTADAIAEEARAGRTSRVKRDGLRAATKLQVVMLEQARSGGAGGWKTVQSVGLEVGGVMPRLARLWGPGPSVVLVSSLSAAHALEPRSPPLQGAPSLGGGSEDGASDEDEEAEACSLLLSRAVWAGDAWTCDVRAMSDEAHGDLEWIGVGGPPAEPHALPLLGLKARGGVGVHDMHAFQLCGADGGALPAVGALDAPEAVHRASFSGISYIQGSREEVKEVTFDADATQTVVLDSSETANIYVRNHPGRRTAPQQLVEVSAEDDIIIGHAALPHALLTLTTDQLVLHHGVPREEESSAGAEEEDAPLLLPNGMAFPEHLLDDW